MSRCAALGLALLLGGCATLPPPAEVASPEIGWAAHAADLKRVQAWQLRGRLAIQTEDDSWSGSLRWQQDHEQYQIDFAGPFGQGAASLTGDLQRVVLKTADDELVGFAGPEELLHERLGWQFPVSELRFWVIGLPSPRSPLTLQQLDEFGRLKQLQQSDWTIDYRRYQSVGTRALPDKVFISNQRLSLKLIIDAWELTPLAEPPVL